MLIGAGRLEGMDLEHSQTHRANEPNNSYLKGCATLIGQHRDPWYAAYQDAPVNIRNHRMRWIEDRSRRVIAAGERLEVRIPFEDESELFIRRPTPSA